MDQAQKILRTFENGLAQKFLNYLEKRVLAEKTFGFLFVWVWV